MLIQCLIVAHEQVDVDIAGYSRDYGHQQDKCYYNGKKSSFDIPMQSTKYDGKN